MAKNRRVNLVIRVKMPNGKRRYCKPVLAPNGRIKPLYARVNGIEERHPEGVYIIRYRVNNHLTCETVGADPNAALAKKQQRELYLKALVAGAVPAPPPVIPRAVQPKEKKRPLAQAIDGYLNDVSGQQRAWSTERHYQNTLRLFWRSLGGELDKIKRLTGSPKRMFLEDITRHDILEYTAYLRQKGNAPRTVANLISYLRTFFTTQNLPWPMLKTDRIRYTKKIVSAYSHEEVQRVMAVANQEEQELYQFFLCTGCREQEVAHACWTDVDFGERTFTVREKRDFPRFQIKDKEEREIPIPAFLVDLLRARRLRYPETRLIFPGRNGKPNGHMLRELKLLAFRNGLNCGHCVNKKGRTCDKHPVCEAFGLHKWRKTFATWHHHRGVSAHELMKWLGHSSLDTTLAYLAASNIKSPRTRELVDSTFAGLTTSLAVGGAA